jgi:hypothetical protein
MKKRKLARDTVVVLSGFGDPGWQLDSMTMQRKNPSAFNGRVEIVRYRITVEIVKEPAEEYHGRLQRLWDECDNHHHVGPLKSIAEIFGYELKGEYGSKRGHT